MKNRKIRYLLTVALVISMTFVLVGCGSDTTVSTSTEEANKGAMFSNDMEMVLDGQTQQGGDEVISDSQKIVQTYNFEIETKEFDKSIERLEAKILELKGYIETSNSYGSTYMHSENRMSEYKIRIPKSQSENFTETVKSEFMITRKSVSTEDVTLEYIDVESRVNSLLAEKKSLEEILLKAETVQDIMDIRDRLTSVIGDIEAYQRKMNAINNQVDYVTFNIEIHEVDVPQSVEDQGIWTEISEKLSQNFAIVGFSLRSIFVFFVSSIPQLMIIVIVVIFVLLIVKICVKKKGKNKKQ